MILLPTAKKAAWQTHGQWAEAAKVRNPDARSREKLRRKGDYFIIGSKDLRN